MKQPTIRTGATGSRKTPPRHTLSGIATRPDTQRMIRPEDVPLIKGMLIRGDMQSDIAAYFGVNSGRICEINTGRRYGDIKPAPPETLPSAGPYMALRSAHKAKETLEALRDLIDQSLAQIELWELPRRSQ
jgi:hypothetical protein